MESPHLRTMEKHLPPLSHEELLELAADLIARARRVGRTIPSEEKGMPSARSLAAMPLEERHRVLGDLAPTEAEEEFKSGMPWTGSMG